ncbi:MAG: hypothetical protein IKX75_00935, partial [Desulfovibrio sp.]|nr:hypothetical protein [Desulfovibrio sp.]
MASAFGALVRLEDERLDLLRDLPLALCGHRLAGAALSCFVQERFAYAGSGGDLARFLAQWRSPDAFVPV